MNATCIDSLYQYLLRAHCRSGALIGPDPGVRFKYRIWRFLKSATRWYPWKDDLCYMQTQGYWVLANWRLSDQGQTGAVSTALACCEHIMRSQRADGAWEFPDPEWRGRVTTVEGLWSSFALLESFRRTGENRFVEPVLLWDRFFKQQIGFQEYRHALAVNYFAGRADTLVPNNSFSVIRYLAQLDQATQSNQNAALIDRLLSFLELTQQPNGEFPYELDQPRMRHFQCFQYHGFLLLDLLDYYRISACPRAVTILHGLARFLMTGVTASGDVMYQCGIQYRHVNYHAAVCMAALHQYWLHFQADSPDNLAQQIPGKVCLILNQLQAKQRHDGSFPHSRGDYRFLADRRSYPRYLAMMLLHLMMTEQQSVSLAGSCSLENNQHSHEVAGLHSQC